MNSSINQVDSSVYNAFGTDLPFPQFMPPMPYQMAYPYYPTMFNGSFVQPICVTPNMNLAVNHSGMNYTGNIHPTMINPMQYPHSTPVLSPNCSPNGQISLNANSNSIIPTFQNDGGNWLHFFTMPSRFHEAQPITPISPFESSLSIGQDDKPLSSENHFHAILSMKTLIPSARRNISIQKANKRKLDENEMVLPMKKLKNGYTMESILDDRIVLPSPRRNSDGPTGAIFDIMPMPPPAPGSLYAGSMACNRHPDDISAICSAAHQRHVVPASSSPIRGTRSRKEKSPRILSSIRKRNEYIYSSDLMETVFPIASSSRDSVAYNETPPSTSQVVREDEVTSRLADRKDVRHEPSPMRTPVYYIPRSLVLAGPSNAHSQDEIRFVSGGNKRMEGNLENGEEISIDNREWMK